MSTEFILKAPVALLPVIVLIIVLYRLDSHRLLGTHFIVRMYLAGAGIAVLCYFVNAFGDEYCFYVHLIKGVDLFLYLFCFLVYHCL